MESKKTLHPLFEIFLLLILFILQAYLAFFEDIEHMRDPFSSFEEEVVLFSILLFLLGMLLFYILKKTKINWGIQKIIIGCFFALYSFNANYQIFNGLVASWSTFTPEELIHYAIYHSKFSVPFCVSLYFGVMVLYRKFVSN